MNKYIRLLDLKKMLEATKERTTVQEELLAELNDILVPYYQYENSALSMCNNRCPACGRAL